MQTFGRLLKKIFKLFGTCFLRQNNILYLFNYITNKHFMKKLLLLAFIILGINTYSQEENKATKNPDQKTIEGAIYSDKEKEQLLSNFLNDAYEKLNMTIEVKEKYTETLYDTYNKMLALRQNRSLTKRDAKYESKKAFASQESKLKEILTPDQLQKHDVLFNPIQKSVFFRIDKY